MKNYAIIGMCLVLAACNSVYVKPNSMDSNGVIYARFGGYGMRRSIKENLESRGHTVMIGRAHSDAEFGDGDSGVEIIGVKIPDEAKYIVRVTERRETFNPFWCPFNGFWWWNFNVSISNKNTGEEIMTWRGRGCANSSLRKLDKILDKMESSHE